MMTEHDESPTDIRPIDNRSTDFRPTPTAADQPDTESAAVDALMDHVAAQLQSQMQTANRHLRKRAARLLDPRRVSRG